MILALWVCATLPAGGDEPTPQQVFERRILPIFKSPNPSSCAQCHLAGVDLKNYILPSHEKTFVSLRDQGLIDLEKPEASKILRLISMGEEDKKGPALIAEKVRKAELEAFAAWIKASCADKALREAPALDAAQRAQPKRPVEVIRHARIDKVLESFEATLWSQRMRCWGCHSPSGSENAKLVAENGPEMSWIKPEGAEATLNYLRASRLIDLKVPERSLILLKPTNQVKHGGGQKLIVGDMAYKGFRAWLEDYAKTVNDKYARAAELPGVPKIEYFGTEIWLKIVNTPPAWADKLLQADVHAWDAAKKAWEPEPIATSDRLVWGKGKLWQHGLALMATRGSDRAKAWEGKEPSLPAGRYLVRVYVDFPGKLQRDWKAALGKADLVGEKEIDASWSRGYGSMTVLEAAQLRR